MAISVLASTRNAYAAKPQAYQQKGGRLEEGAELELVDTEFTEVITTSRAKPPLTVGTPIIIAALPVRRLIETDVELDTGAHIQIQREKSATATVFN